MGGPSLQDLHNRHQGILRKALMCWRIIHLVFHTGGIS